MNIVHKLMSMAGLAILAVFLFDSTSFNCVYLTESLAAQEKDTGGVCFVSAFQGLFAPYWNAEARGYVCVYMCYVQIST